MEPEETDRSEELGAQSAQRRDSVPVQETEGPGEELAASSAEVELPDSVSDDNMPSKPKPEQNSFTDSKNSEPDRTQTDQRNIEQKEDDCSKPLDNDDATSESPCPDLKDEQSVTAESARTNSASELDLLISKAEDLTFTSSNRDSPQPADAVCSDSTRRSSEVTSGGMDVVDGSKSKERTNDQKHSSTPEKNDLASSLTSISNLHDSGHTADGNKSQETAEDLLPYLVKKAFNKNYHPIREDVLNFIKGHAEGRVKFGAIYQAPNNSKDIEIVGENVEFLKSVIFETMEQFPDYTFKITECTNPMHVRPYLGNGVFTVRQKFREGSPTGYTDSHDTPITSSCGLILLGESDDEHPITEYYVVMAGHGVMEGNWNELFARNISVERVREQVFSNADKVRCRLELNLSGRTSINDLCGLHPKFCLRWFQQEQPRNLCEMFMNDIAVLPIKSWQLLGEEEQQPGAKTSELVLAMTERRDYNFSSQPPEAHTNVIRDVIIPLSSPDILRQMGEAGVLLVVGNLYGHMIPCRVPIVSPGSTVPLAIEFVVSNGVLYPGQSGLIVYVKHKDTQDLYPFGLFVGQRDLENNPEVYVAVVLYMALEELKNLYPHLTNLRPIPHVGQPGSSVIQCSDFVTCPQLVREFTENHQTGEVSSSPSGNTVTDSGVGPSG